MSTSALAVHPDNAPEKRMASFDIADLLPMQAAIRPDAPFLAGLEHADRRHFTFAQTQEGIGRLARMFGALALKPGDALALIGADGADMTIGFLACVHFGLMPVLVPVDLPFAGLRAAIVQTDVKAFLLADRGNGFQLAETCAGIAASVETIRFVFSLGTPEHDGVIALDPAFDPPDGDITPFKSEIASPRKGHAMPVLVVRGDGTIARRTAGTLIAGALDMLRVADIDDAVAIVSALPPSRSLAVMTGCLAALISGSTLIHVPARHWCHALATARAQPSLLVWPAQIEHLLSQMIERDGPPAAIAIAQTLPGPIDATARLDGQTCDIWCLDEVGSATIARRYDDHPHAHAHALATLRDGFVEIERLPDGRLLARGAAIEDDGSGLLIDPDRA